VQGQNVAFVSNRRVCLTTEGRTGLVPARTQVSDKLVLLKPAIMPFAVRPEPTTLSRRTVDLLGGSYVDGVMYGRAARDVSMSDAWTEIIIQ
jgi:hypothetical protein